MVIVQLHVNIKHVLFINIGVNVQRGIN